MRSLCLFVLLLTVGLCGCSIPGIDPPQASPHPFALTEKIVERQAVAAESSASTLTNLLTETKATNGKLDALIDQLQLTAGQQCDLLKEVQEQGAREKEVLSRQLSVISPEPSSAGYPPSAISQEPHPLFPPPSSLSSTGRVCRWESLSRSGIAATGPPWGPSWKRACCGWASDRSIWRCCPMRRKDACTERCTSNSNRANRRRKRKRHRRK